MVTENTASSESMRFYRMLFDVASLIVNDSITARKLYRKGEFKSFMFANTDIELPKRP